MKNKMWKKFSAGFLAVALATSMLPATALASEVPVESETEEDDLDGGVAEETSAEGTDAGEEATEAVGETAEDVETAAEEKTVESETEAEAEEAKDAAAESVSTENSADVLLEGEEENSYSISFSGRDRDVEYDYESGDTYIQGYYWSYDDDYLTLDLDVSELSELTDYTITYDVGNWDDLESGTRHSFGGESSGLYTIGDDSESITMDIKAIYEAMESTIDSLPESTPMDDSGFQVRACVTADDETLAETNLWVAYASSYMAIEDEPEFNDGEYVTGDAEIYTRVYEDVYLENAKYPMGKYVDVVITDCEVEVTEGEEDAVTAEWSEDGDYLYVWANSLGSATVSLNVSIYCDGYNPASNKAADYSGTLTHTFTVVEDIYNIDVTSDSDSDGLLPGESLTLTATTNHQYYNAEWGYPDFETLEDVTYQWTVTEGEKYISISESTGSVCTVTAKKDAGYGEAYIQVTAVDSNGNELATAEYGVYVTEAYYQISYKAEDEEGNTLDLENLDPGVAATVTLNVTYKYVDEYGENQAEAVSADVVRYGLYYDSDVVSIEDLEPDEYGYAELAADSFVMTKTGNRDTSVEVLAIVYNESETPIGMSLAELCMDYQDYSVYFAGDSVRGLAYDDYYTWGYSGEELTLALNTDSLSGKDGYTISYEIGTWEATGYDEYGDLNYEWVADTSVIEGTDYTVDEDANTITLDMDAIAETMTVVSVEEYGFNVRVVVTGPDGASTWTENDIWVDYRTPVYYYSLEDDTVQIVTGSFYDISEEFVDFYIEDSTYPYGAYSDDGDLVFKITNISKDQDTTGIKVTFDEEGNYWLIDGNEEGDYTLTASYCVVDQETGEEVDYLSGTCTIYVTVSGAIYYMTYDDDSSVYYVHPGVETDLTVTLWKYYINESTGLFDLEEVEDASLTWSVLNLYGEEYEDAPLSVVSIDENGYSIKVTAATPTDQEICWATVQPTAIVDGEEVAITFDGVIFVVETWWIEGTEEYDAEPGDVIALDNRLYKYNEETEADEKVENATYELYLDEIDCEEDDYAEIAGILDYDDEDLTITIDETSTELNPFTLTFSLVAYVDGAVMDTTSIVIHVCDHDYAITSDADGWTTYTCSKCGASYQEGWTGVLQASNGNWYYYLDGVIQDDYTGFQSNSHGTWYIEGGQVTFTANSVIKDEDINDCSTIDGYGSWWYVVRSEVQFDYTGVANYKNDDGWWYIKDGKVDFSANTVAKNNHGWWYVVGGKVRFDYTGVANYKNDYGWWYIKNGKVDFTFTGKAANKYGTWNVVNGKVKF